MSTCLMQLKSALTVLEKIFSEKRPLTLNGFSPAFISSSCYIFTSQNLEEVIFKAFSSDPRYPSKNAYIVAKIYGKLSKTLSVSILPRYYETEALYCSITL